MKGISTNESYYNGTQRELFKKTFGFDAHCFSDKDKVRRTQKWSLDIILFGRYLTKNDKEYDRDNCLYKGKTCYTMDYIRLKYGKSIVQLINDLIDSKFDNKNY